MMKNPTIIFLGIVLFIILVISLFSSTVVVPYSKDSLFSIQYPYEGFTDKDKKKEGMAKKVEGFEGLQSSPLGDEKPLDLYSKLPSGSCEPGPYSNSTGYLCLDQKAKDLLMTRGGNQTA